MAVGYVMNVDVPKPADLGAAPWNVRDAKPITIVFGKNGSGKSRFLRAWRDMDPDCYHYILPERTGEISYQSSLLDEQTEGKKRREQSRRNFLQNYRQQVVARIQGYFSTRGNVRAAQLPGDPSDLELRLSTLLPDFSVELNTKNPPYTFKRTSGGAQVTGIDELSSGEAQILTLGLDILTVAAIWDIENRGSRVMLIDEPDAHVHSDLQARFADFLVGVADKYKLQLVIATHSSTLLAAVAQFARQDAGILYLDRIAPELRVLPMDKYKRELAACLGGHALMGPLFGVPLLLVEGDDDYRIWSQVPRHHVVSFAVIPSHGEEIFQYQENLEQLFAALREDQAMPSGFALLDHDKQKPTPQQKSQQNIRFIQLACHEAENLYLSDEVLALLGIVWAQASAEIVAQAPNYPNKQQQLATAATWNRADHDFKNLIHEISAILDTKQVHWTIRVGQAVGKARPLGQLADFLGQDVVTALWGPANPAVQ
jgi:predicted ATPase